ncbi:serine/threonine-protein kinase [Nocardiopsis sp. N85]|uniref:serine/threonine-protein kinase n=1 Tax=Nocardiopsis sp. N85 TaxID=3029400 RepID=UPI00237FC325|nr:serine/threonine-protein kinase [Nocardiopsis sp. N85]MDE3725193.1 serine/threonine-protein kinase [Nocardiopsis sp. N85]
MSTSLTPEPGLPEPGAPAGPPVGLTPLLAGDPRSLGPYRLVGRIGAGGMGAVYGGMDPSSGRCVAVKTVHVRYARERRYREAFAREVGMLARAHGIGTAELYAADVDATVPWLAFEYIPGRDLRAHVRAFGPLEGEMLRAFAVGTAEGLAALHAAGIAHRDIKPGNVVLSPTGPKIVDFGIATEIGADRSTDRSASYGTPGWVAPERYTGVTAAPAADVFAWGGLVALAATGRDPFGQGTPQELRARVEAGDHDVDGVPETLRPLVEAALSVDPEARPRAVALMRDLLPEPAEVGLAGEERVPAARTLRALLDAHWRGVDAAGHDPLRWAGALGLTSAVGLAGTALLSGTGTGTGGAGAAAAGTAGGAATTGTAASGATASGGVITGHTATGAAAGTQGGGVLTTVAGSKVATASAGVLLAGGLATGGYLIYDQVAGGPEEVVLTAAGVLEEGEGFTARVERSPVGGGGPVVEEYAYSAEGRTFLMRGEAMGEGTVAAAVHRGELYVYAPRTEDLSIGTWYDSAGSVPVDASVTADSVSSALVTNPLRALAESGRVTREEGEGVYSGPTTLGILDGGVLTESEAVGRVEVGGDGAPVRAEYTTDRWEVRIDFTATDGPVVVEDPQLSSVGDGFGWAAVHAPVCGSVSMAGREWDVQASGWEVDCEYAMGVSEMMNDAEFYGENADPGRAEVLRGYSGTGGTTWLVDEAMACSIFRRDLGGTIEGRTFFLSPCTPVTVVGESDEDPLFSFVEVEFGGRTLIDYHERA